MCNDCPPKPKPPRNRNDSGGWEWYGDALREWKEARSRRHGRGGTYNATAFSSKPKRNDPSKTDHLFNSPGDGSRHGHVVEQRLPDGSVTYPYVRDVEGNVYRDDRRR